MLVSCEAVPKIAVLKTVLIFKDPGTLKKYFCLFSLYLLVMLPVTTILYLDRADLVEPYPGNELH